MKKSKNNISAITRASKVKNIMSFPVITLTKDETVHKAMDLMSKHHFSTIVVTDKDKPIGLITEKEIISNIFLKSKNPKKVSLGNFTKKPIPKLAPNDSLLKASNIMAKDIRKLVVIDNNRLVGILTEMDVLKSFNIIYNNYKYLLWNPWYFVAIFLFLIIVFIYTILK